MKILLSIIIIILFSPFVFSDEISDFQIEGITVGDSLLSIYSKEEIENAGVTEYPNSKRIIELSFLTEDHDDYHQLTYSVASSDEQYIILSVSGYIDFSDNINDCLLKKDEITKEIDEIINDENLKVEEYTYTYDNIGDGNNIAYVTDYDLSDGAIRVYCNEWSEVSKSLDEYRLNDSLSIQLETDSYLDFINNEAY